MILIRKTRASTVALRKLSTEPIKEFNDPDLKMAKPFEEVPKQNFLSIDMFRDKMYKKPVDEWMTHFQKIHGDLLRLPGFLGLPSIVMAFNQEDIKKVYRHEGPWPYRLGGGIAVYWRDHRKDLFKDFHGLVLQQGESWQKYRTIINPIMMQPRTVNLYIPEIDSVVKDFIEVTKKSLDENSETTKDFGAYIQRYTMEAIGTIAFETRLNVLEPREGNKGAELAKLLDEMLVLTYKLDFLPSIWRFYATPNFKRFITVMDKISEIILDYVEDAVKRFEKEGSQKPAELQGVLYKILKINKEAAIIMGLDMLAAGIDTTSSSIKSLLYLLAANPSKQQKLREEILQILPSKTDELTAENMKNMPYLRACMKEAHRVYPVIPGTARRLPYDIALSGYRVRKGSDVILPHGMISMQEKNFPKAQEFIPERWLKDESHAAAVGCPHSKTAHAFTFQPFGFGPRACIGKRFAELETSILTTRLIREFNISWHYPAPKVQTHMIKQIVGDLKFKLTKYE